MKTQHTPEDKVTAMIITKDYKGTRISGKSPAPELLYAISTYGFLIPLNSSISLTEFLIRMENYSSHPRTVSLIKSLSS